MTRCRCAECGAVLAVKREVNGRGIIELLVHPCGACLQEAAADAIAGLEDHLADQRLEEQAARD